MGLPPSCEECGNTGLVWDKVTLRACETCLEREAFEESRRQRAEQEAKLDEDFRDMVRMSEWT